METPIAIRTVALSRRFRSGSNEIVIFDGLDLEISQGERVAITGESGAGKSTLLYMLGGLDRPSNGKIYFGDKEITSLPESALAQFRNQTVGFVWQNHSLLPEFTALENVMMPLLIRGSGQEEAAERSLAVLDEVGLRQRAEHRAGELSGGEQQRVALARALAGNPRVLLADEPTGNLDFRTGDMIISLLSDLHRTHTLTSLYVTHNLGFAARCDRVFRLEKGVLVDETGLATPQQTSASNNHSRGYV
ncbi:MAG TPA: ABC transporter ATP-binding protein [Bryobacteraceae bacterium]|nr:ABC transporter ATP-binding protein [Bryobacteraceae bacterium]